MFGNAEQLNRTLKKEGNQILEFNLAISGKQKTAT